MLVKEDANHALAKTGSSALCTINRLFLSAQKIYKLSGSVSLHEIHMALILYHMQLEERDYPALLVDRGAA